MRLKVRIVDSKKETRVMVAGELDLATVQDLKTAMETVARGTAEEVVLDFTELTYLGSVGVKVIVKTLDELEARGRRLAITGAQGSVQAVLQMLGLTYLVRQRTKRRSRRMSADGDGDC